jgi:hypothetical protein
VTPHQTTAVSSAVNGSHSPDEAPAPARQLWVTDEAWRAAFYPTPAPEWWLEFRFLEEGIERTTPPVIRFLQKPEAISAWLGKYRQVSDDRAQAIRAGCLEAPSPLGLFWGVQPRAARRGRKEDVAAFVAFACDLDCKDRTDVAEAERPRAIWHHLHANAPAPSIVTWTGHGVHAYWLLDEPLSDKPRGEAIQAAMAHALNGDHVQDCTRILRWPHTRNYKRLLDGPTPEVKVIWWRPELRYTWQTLDEHFSGPPAQPMQTDIWRRFEGWLAQDSDLRRLWEGWATHLPIIDRSRLDMSLAWSLKRRGFDAADFNTITARAPWNRGKLLAPPYLERTWAKTCKPLPERSLAGAPSMSPTAGNSQTAVPRIDPSLSVSAADANLRLPGLLLPALPESAWTDWARTWRDTVRRSTEAADEFHYLALLTVLGITVGRRICVSAGRPVYPNVYAMLVGPTGDRKSTAADLALSLLPPASEVQFLNGVGSQEGLMELMAAAQQSQTLLYVDEMAALLKKARRESSGCLIEFITEIFHSPDFKTHATRSRSIHLNKPTLGILGCSTPTWLEAALDQEDVLGGFTNRFVYVTASPKPDLPLPDPPEAQGVAELRGRIAALLQMPPRQLQWEAGARAQWDDFYVEWRRSLNQLGEHASALLRRCDLYILKFASLAAAMDGTPAIQSHHLQPAIELGRFLAGCAYQILGGLGEPRDSRLEQLIEVKLAADNGSMRRKQLRQAIGGRVTGQNLDRVLAAMERNGIIRQFEDTAARGAPTVVQLTGPD